MSVFLRYVIGIIILTFSASLITVTVVMIAVCLFVMTRAVTRAVNNLVAPHKLTSDAVDVRQELDLRIGDPYQLHLLPITMMIICSSLTSRLLQFL